MDIGILILLIPLLAYLISAFTVKKGTITSPDDFFIAYKRIGTTAFSNSSIAYAFQVATVYLFLIWGASNIVLIPTLNAIFWGVGIFLFSLCLPKLKKFIGSDNTLHGFLGEKYGNSVRFITSILTIIGLLGVAVAEIVWGSSVLYSIIADPLIIYIITVLAAFYVLVYISYGGQISSIRTDQIQLIFSYIGIFGLIVYLLYIAYTFNDNFSPTLSFSILFLAIYTPIILLIRRGKFNQVEGEIKGYNKMLVIGSNILTTLFLISIFIFAILNITKINLSVSISNLTDLTGFGLTGLLSLVLLPMFWQFVDMTNWQRILAVHEKDSNQVQNIKRGLLIYSLESPYTWIVFIIAGILMASTKTDIVNAGDLFINLPKEFIASASLIENLLGYGFIVSIISILLSTVDSVLLAAMFTFVYDTNPRTKAILDRGNGENIKGETSRILKSGKAFGLIILLIGLFFYLLFDITGKGGQLFIGMLFAFYTAQLSFLPSVLGAIFLKKLPNKSFVLMSIIIGGSLGVSTGLYATFINDTYQWYPVLVTLLSSSLLYGGGYLVGEK